MLAHVIPPELCAPPPSATFGSATAIVIIIMITSENFWPPVVTNLFSLLNVIYRQWGDCRAFPNSLAANHHIWEETCFGVYTFFFVA